jgi:hypothetical protein
VDADQPGNATYAPAPTVTVPVPITPATLHPAVVTRWRSYGSANPPVKLVYAGFVHGDTVAVLTGAPTCSTPADVMSPAGTSYLVTCGLGSLAAPNYVISPPRPGRLTILKARIQVVVGQVFRLYGEDDPAIEPRFEGFKNGDTEAVISGSPDCMSTAEASSPVGHYPIGCDISQLSAENYRFTFAGAKLTVKRATLTFTATDQTRPVGAPNPLLGGTLSGFMNGEDESLAAGAARCRTFANAISPPAQYAITCSVVGLHAPNYVIRSVPGILTVT